MTLHNQHTIRNILRRWRMVIQLVSVVGIMLVGVSVVLQQTSATKRTYTYTSKPIDFPEVPFFAVAGTRLAPVMPQAVMPKTLIINPGGGMDVTGNDGIRMQFNRQITDLTRSECGPSKGDAIYWRGVTQFYADADHGVALSIGGGTDAANPGSATSLRTILASCPSSMIGNTTFSDITIGSLTGSATLCGDTTTAGTLRNCSSMYGSGSAVITYSHTVGGRIFSLIRSITYTYPNPYFLEQFTINVPSGNTSMVKLYKAGDTAPGGSNSGVGVYVSNPVKRVMSVEVNTKVFVAMKEVRRPTGMSTFEGAYETSYGGYDYIYRRINNNLDLGFYADPNTHNVAYGIQYTIGSNPGTYNEENYTYVGLQGLSLEAEWLDAVATRSAQLDIVLVNSYSTNATGNGFRFTIPRGMYITNTLIAS